MKLHKICNVDLKECSAEQKIAYNIAFRCEISGGSEFRKLLATDPKGAAELCTKLRDIHMDAWDRDPGSRRYDREAIYTALDNGLHAYLENHFIATRYEQIGKAFPLRRKEA